VAGRQFAAPGADVEAGQAQRAHRFVAVQIAVLAQRAVLVRTTVRRGVELTSSLPDSAGESLAIVIDDPLLRSSTAQAESVHGWRWRVDNPLWCWGLRWLRCGVVWYWRAR
jgi:hypothetical protein